MGPRDQTSDPILTGHVSCDLQSVLLKLQNENYHIAGTGDPGVPTEVTDVPDDLSKSADEPEEQ